MPLHAGSFTSIRSRLRSASKGKLTTKQEMFSDPKPFNPQESSPLFQLPGEIRNLIFHYALLPTDDSRKEYARDTCYKRPEENARHRIHVDLLRTCKAVHSEAWFLPWANADHFIYLANGLRRPPSATDLEELQKVAKAMHDAQGEQLTSQIYVYAQCSPLENGDLERVLQLQHFFPTVMTLTIRHTDWWWWEIDRELYVKGEWVQRCRFPNSIKQFRICFESIQWKTAQIQRIAAQAKSNWFFHKQDGTILSAEASPSAITRWTGSSTWNGRRWLRDEARTNEIDYYCETVTWSPSDDSPMDEKVFRASELRGGQVGRRHPAFAMVQVDHLEKAGLLNACAPVIRRHFTQAPVPSVRSLYD